VERESSHFREWTQEGTLSAIGEAPLAASDRSLTEALINGCEPGGSDLNEIDGPKLVVRSQRGGDAMSDESSVSDTPQPAEVQSGQPTMAVPPPGSPTGRTRISGLWVGVIIAVVVLALDLVFIIQNSQSVKVSFLSGNVNIPLGVALLLAAVGGVLLAGIVASLRIWQLRHRLHQSK
jgi:lipopolysaccharide assembly protein A